MFQSVQIGYFKFKGHGQGHKVIGLGDIWKGFISWVWMPNMKSLLWLKSYDQG